MATPKRRTTRAGASNSARPKAKNTKETSTRKGAKESTRKGAKESTRKGTKVRGGSRPPAKKDNTMLYVGICGGALLFLILAIALGGGDDAKPVKKTASSQIKPTKKVKRKVPMDIQKAAYKDRYNQEEAIEQAIESEFGDAPDDIDERRNWGRKKQSEKTKRINKMDYDLQQKHKVSYNELNEIYQRGLQNNWTN